MVKKYYNKIKSLGIGKFILILLAGMLLVLSYSTPPKDEDTTHEEMINTIGLNDELGEQLEKIMGRISGVSEIQVLITYQDSGEKILKSYTNTEYEENNEIDSQGGTRKDYSQKENSEYLYQGESPYIVMQKKPTICGVLVVYRGDKGVQKDIVEAAKVATGVDYNRIKVVLMN